MIQLGPGVELKAKGPDGQPLWAYWYRIEGRGSRAAGASEALPWPVSPSMDVTLAPLCAPTQGGVR
jgi:hypothetical protein